MTLTVHVKTGKSIERVALLPDGSLEVCTSKRPHDNEANRAVASLLSEALGLPKRAVTILKGQKSHKKLVMLDGVPKEALSRLLKEP
ncbi:MAG: DUF167 family protein [Nitrospirota bacterium]|nr:DUF167 family protein [Nitrospirota bacterium]